MLCVLFIALIIAQILFGSAVLQLDMLPGNIVAILFGFMAVITLLLGIGLWSSLKKRTVSAKIGRFIVAIFCLIGIAGSLFGQNALNQMKDTISNVTNEPVISAIVQLYVRADDPASTIDDTASYTFGVTKSYDWENTSKTIKQIEDHLNLKLNIVTYPTVFAVVDALYQEEVDAIFMNSGYVDILEEMEGYLDFSQRTRTVYEYAIIETQPPTEPTIDKPDIPPLFGNDEPQKDTVEPFVIYLSGTDSRSKVTGTNRSDVNILAVVNPQTQQILLINTPRDSYVANTAANGALDKLTHCGLYGIKCSVSTLENLYGTKIDYYARINFTGFETLIDAIGGVTIYSNIAFNTTDGKYPIVVGENHLNGVQALAYARERYSLPGGERERGQNQMKIITAAIKKMLSGSLFTNYAEILNSLEDMFTTNFPQEKISQLVKSQLLQMTDWEIFSYATNGTPSRGITCSMPNIELYVLQLSEESVQKGAELIQSVLNGEIITNKDLK